MWLDTQPSDAQHVLAVVDSKADEPVYSAKEAAKELETLFRRDLSILNLVVRRIVRSASDAEDIVQDAFIRVWRASEQGAIRSPRAVLFKTAYNLALNHLRDKRARAVELVDPSIDPASDAPSAEENLIFLQDMRACREAFDRLPFRCRQALSLRIVEELSYKEMSERLGLSVSTLEKHFVRGRRLCRNILQRDAAKAERSGTVTRAFSGKRIAAYDTLLSEPVLAAAE